MDIEPDPELQALLDEENDLTAAQRAVTDDVLAASKARHPAAGRRYVPHTNDERSVAMDAGTMDNRLHEIAAFIGSDRPDYAYVLEEAARRLRVLGDLFTRLEGEVAGARELLPCDVGDEYDSRDDD